MSRKRADVPTTKNLHYRVTAGEAEAEAELVRRHGEALRKHGVAAPSANAWFRALLRREAEREGIEIVDLGEQPDPEKPGAKRRRSQRTSRS